MMKVSRRELLKRMAVGFAVGALIGLNAKAFAGEPVRPKPNIVYVLTDQWRAQATGYAGQWLTSTVNRSSITSQETNAGFNNQRDIPSA